MAIDMEQMRKKFNEAQNLSERLGFDNYKPQWGKSKDQPHTNKVKLFSWPPNSPKGALARVVQKHFNLGAKGNLQCVCPKTYGRNNPCPICDWVEANQNSDNPATVKRAGDLGVRERYMMFVADWDQYEKDGKKLIKVYDAPGKTYRRIMQLMLEDWGDFTAMDSALVTLSCYEQGRSLPKITDVGGSPKRVNLKLEEWLPAFPNWDNILKADSIQRISQLLNGQDAAEDDGAPSAPPAAPAQESVSVSTAPQPEPEPEPAPAPAPKAAASVAQPAAPAATAPAAGSAAGKKPGSLQDLLARAKR